MGMGFFEYLGVGLGLGIKTHTQTQFTQNTHLIWLHPPLFSDPSLLSSQTAAAAAMLSLPTALPFHSLIPVPLPAVIDHTRHLLMSNNTNPWANSSQLLFQQLSSAAVAAAATQRQGHAAPQLQPPPPPPLPPHHQAQTAAPGGYPNPSGNGANVNPSGNGANTSSSSGQDLLNDAYHPLGARDG